MAGRAQRTSEDDMLHAADLAAYEAAYGHVERRHAEVAWLHAGLKFTTAALGGLLMALGFHPLVVFVTGIAIWRSLESVVEGQRAADSHRRAAHGVD